MAETETPVKETPVEEEAKVEEAPVEAPPAEEAPAEAPPAEETPAKEEAPAEEAKTEETPKKSDKKPSKKKALILLLLLLAIGIAVCVYFFFFRKDDDDGRIPYAEGVVLFGGEDIEPVEAGWIKLTYDYEAKSSDGVNFTCLLTNDPANLYDLYFDIYADSRLEDRIFLSGLIRPGYALTEIILDHELPAGTTTCYVVFNQVDTDGDGNQSIVNQMLVTVDFIVQ